MNSYIDVIVPTKNILQFSNAQEFDFFRLKGWQFAKIQKFLTSFFSIFMVKTTFSKTFQEIFPKCSQCERMMFRSCLTHFYRGWVTRKPMWHFWAFSVLTLVKKHVFKLENANIPFKSCHRSEWGMSFFSFGRTKLIQTSLCSPDPSACFKYLHRCHSSHQRFSTTL